MNRLLLSLLVAASLLGHAYHATAQASAPAKQWDKTFGGSDPDRLAALQQTSDGGYILGGTSYSGRSGDKTQPNEGLDDYWILKLDAAGSKQWDKTFGGRLDDELTALQQTSDGGYILGGVSESGVGGNKTQASQGNSDYWVVKLDANGIKQWDKSFGGRSAENLSALHQTSDGGYLLAGSSNSGISGNKTQASQGNSDYWILKLDANGIKQWDKSFGGSQSDVLSRLQQTSDGGYLLAGSSLSPISGDKTQHTQWAWDYWILKLDATFTKQWDKTFGGSAFDVLSSLQQTSDGGYLLGGSSNSGISGDKTQANQGTPNSDDYWVVKLNAAGIKQWDKTVGGNSTDALASVQQTSDGGYLLAGSSLSGVGGHKTQASQGGNDFWIVKLDAMGSMQWDKTVGGSSYDALSSLQQTSDGGYLLAGSSQSVISGDKTQLTQWAWDYWLVKLGAAPLATTAATTRLALSAYPNPARSQLTLRGPLGTPYQLLNQLGQVVRAGKLSAQPLDVYTLPIGLYLLRDATTGRTTKLVKE